MATVVPAGTSRHRFPYGGGIKICPDRLFAKTEMVASAILLLRMSETELLDPVVANRARSDINYFPFGALSPDQMMPVIIRGKKT